MTDAAQIAARAALPRAAESRPNVNCAAQHGLSDSGECTPLVDTLFAGYERQVVGRTNRIFAWLLTMEWICGVTIAAVWPELSAGHASLALSIGMGALLAAPALALIRWAPYHLATRLVVAAGQTGFTGLLVFLSAGQFESHFYVFVSMAFLALYRDWRVLTVATVFAVVHHLVVGSLWPEVIFWGEGASFWRSVEHGAWLVFENAVLVLICLNSRREMAEICERQKENRQLLDQLEQRVKDRTHDLETEIEARERTAAELQQSAAQHRHLVASLPIGIFETNRRGQLLFANPHFLGLIGLPSSFDPTAVSLADGRIFPVADRARLWQRLEAESDVRGFAATFCHFDGSPFEVIINARLKRTAPGEELACEGTVEDVSVRKRAERDLDALHNQLMMASRQAGMAEVATGVLHNVGNVLTSVNLIVHDVQDRLKDTRLTHLHRVVEILQREQPRLAEFLTTDNAGRQLPEFLGKLDEHLTAENRQLLTDVEGLVRHFEHIREIIVTQQGSAQLFGVTETLNPAQLIEDALRLNAESLERHGIALERIFEPSMSVKADRHKVLQILVNLLKNAKDALQSVKPGDRLIRVAVRPGKDGNVELRVQDNGPGIAAPNLTRIFQHGFTTKPTGHGYGLHSSVLAAREMSGDLVATSEGLGHGSTFILSLPGAKTV